ncbi:hypothetical protein E4S40_06070 [Algoriphagus kandeliae]|uniref:Lipocalin-like domain-containing protein n=1 Tax=Algoriphagus kandeliae TaxID=2562278 RepID=A0A4Y9QXA3_9BACT|nr:hypothetical protein [Algoriphagus kandeliae]TFV95786.1 hypothetical protein E4S40_06070 [Algoriphagus kandeliae]
MKFSRLLFFLPFLMAFQCGEDIYSDDDLLLETGILNSWELSEESINGSSDLLPKCCKYFNFHLDGKSNDLVGRYTYHEDNSGNLDGVFILDPSKQEIIFKGDDGTEILASYSINDEQNYLVLSYQAGRTELVQGYTKVD